MRWKERTVKEKEKSIKGKADNLIKNNTLLMAEGTLSYKVFMCNFPRPVFKAEQNGSLYIKKRWHLVKESECI